MLIGGHFDSGPGLGLAIPVVESVDMFAWFAGKWGGLLIWGFWFGFAVFSVAGSGSVLLTLLRFKLLILFGL